MSYNSYKTVVLEWNRKEHTFYTSEGFEKYFASRYLIQDIMDDVEMAEDIVYHEDSVILAEFIKGIRQNEFPAPMMLRMKMSDLTYRWTQVEAHLIKNHADEAERITILLTDADDAVQTKSELDRALSERDSLIMTLTGGIAIYELTDKLRTLYLTEEMAALLGYSKDELMPLVKEDAFALCYPPDKKTFLLKIKGRKQDEEVSTYEYRLRNKAGRYQWVSSKIRFTRQGHAWVMYTVTTDIDKIKQSESNAKMQREMMEIALKQSDFRFWDYDIRTHRLYRSAAVTEQVGYGDFKDDVPESNIKLGLIHPDDCQAYLDFYHNVQKGVNSRLTFREIHQNGEWDWVDISFKVFFDEMGEPVRAIGVGGNVSAQKKKEEEYAKGFQLYREVSNFAIQKEFKDVFLIDTVTEQVTIIMANGSYMDMKTLPDYDALLQKQVCRYSEGTTDVRNKLRLSVLVEQIKNSPNQRVEYTFKVHDRKGEKLWYRYFISFLHGDSQNVLMLVKDVTGVVLEEEKKRQELEVALEKEKKACEAKSRFLSNMSHDIRTPMNVIINMIRMTKDDIHNKKLALDHLDKISSMSTYLMGIINDILDVSKMESGKVTLKEERYTVTDFYDTIRTMVEPLCRDKNISFETDFKTSDVVVITDKTKMNQIFINLLSNAAKFTPAGGTIKMTCSAVNVEEDYVDWHSTISDNGCGMSRSFQNVMFQPFEQENNKFSANLTGTGLGLTIVKMNVDAMNGKITVESEPGKGTTFHLFLRTKKEKSLRQVKKREQADLSVLSGKHVLLVEDNKLNMEIAKRILEKKHVCATSAFNGQEALDIFGNETEGSFDAVLMDIRMPVMDGLEATRRIRNLNRKDAKTIPIIAMSANAFNEDIENGKKAGMSEYIPKPVEPERLFNVLADSFRRCDL